MHLPMEPRGASSYRIPYLIVLDEVGDTADELQEAMEHNDFTKRSGARAVFVFPDRVEVVPPWGPDDDVVLADDVELDDLPAAVDELEKAAAAADHPGDELAARRDDP